MLARFLRTLFSGVEVVQVFRTPWGHQYLIPAREDCYLGSASCQVGVSQI